MTARPLLLPMTPSGEEAPVFELHRCADMHPAECWQGCSREMQAPAARNPNQTLPERPHRCGAAVRALQCWFSSSLHSTKLCRALNSMTTSAHCALSLTCSRPSFVMLATSSGLELTERIEQRFANRRAKYIIKRDLFQTFTYRPPPAARCVAARALFSAAVTSQFCQTIRSNDVNSGMWQF